jgi:hypothetical protein
MQFGRSDSHNKRHSLICYPLLPRLPDSRRPLQFALVQIAMACYSNRARRTMKGQRFHPLIDSDQFVGRMHVGRLQFEPLLKRRELDVEERLGAP